MTTSSRGKMNNWTNSIPVCWLQSWLAFFYMASCGILLRYGVSNCRYDISLLFISWASCLVRKISGCACIGNAGNVLRVSDPDMHHGTCVTHVPWCMPGSLTGGFLWSRWLGKRSRLSRCMRNPQFYVSGKRTIHITIRVHRPEYSHRRRSTPWLRMPVSLARQKSCYWPNFIQGRYAFGRTNCHILCHPSNSQGRIIYACISCFS